MSDIVRVLRVIEYEGERAWVESTVRGSIHGEMVIDGGVIRAVTVNEFPIQLVREQAVKEPFYSVDNEGKDYWAWFRKDVPVDASDLDDATYLALPRSLTGSTSTRYPTREEALADYRAAKK